MLHEFRESIVVQRRWDKGISVFWDSVRKVYTPKVRLNGLDISLERCTSKGEADATIKEAVNQFNPYA